MRNNNLSGVINATFLGFLCIGTDVPTKHTRGIFGRQMLFRRSGVRFFLPSMSTSYRVTAQELADCMWLSCKETTKHSCDELIQLTKEQGYNFNTESLFNVIEEFLIINLWLISKALAKERLMLDSLHNLYFEGQNNLATGLKIKEQENFLGNSKVKIIDRYKQYYDTWKEGQGDQTLLCNVMLENLFNDIHVDKKIFINAVLLFYINTHVLLYMKAVLEIRTHYNVE